MDIMRPPLNKQVSPAPWLVARSNVDVPSMIRKAHTKQPGASVDDIVRQLCERGMQVSGIIVSMWVRKLRDQTVLAIAVNDQSSVAA